MSTLLSIKFRLKACLFNPCVHPQNFVANLLGKEQVNADTGHRFFLQNSLIDELSALDSYAQDNYAKDLLRIFLESGDEVLDYTEAQRFFSACPIDLTEGGAHRFMSFESKIEAVVDFFSKS